MGGLALGDGLLGGKGKEASGWGRSPGRAAVGAPRWGIGGSGGGGGGGLMDVLGPGRAGRGGSPGAGRLGSGSLRGIGGGGGGAGAGPGRGQGHRTGRASGPVLGQKLSLRGSGLSRKAVLKVLQGARSRIRFCYETRLRGRPDLSGRIQVGFTVARNGKVASAKVLSSQVGDQVLEGCLLRVVKGLRFPRPKRGGSVEIRYSWFFRSEGG